MSKIIKTFKTGQDEEINAYLKENLGNNSNISIFPEVIVVVTESNELAAAQIAKFKEEIKTFYDRKTESLRNLQFIEKQLSEGKTETEALNPETKAIEKKNLVEERTLNEKVIRVADEQIANLEKMIEELKK